MIPEHVYAAAERIICRQDRFGDPETLRQWIGPEATLKTDMQMALHVLEAATRRNRERVCAS